MAEEYVNIDETSVLSPSPAWRDVSKAPARRVPGLSVLHVITGVIMGGAEMMLYKLLARGDRDRFSPTVLSLLGPGPVGARISAMDVPLLTLGMRQERPLSPAMLRLIPLARSVRPSLIQGWMYHGNLAASACALLSGRPPVIWNVRHSIHDMQHENRLTRGFIRLGAALSSSARAIIYNSRLSASQHERLGYDAGKTVVIPNGFDCELFRPRPAMAGRLRKEVNIDPGRVVIGMVARNHPQKDPCNLFKATALLAQRGVDVHVVIVGPDFDTGNAEIMRAIDQAGVADRVSLLGERHDIPDIVAGFDIATLPSAWGEGFPNVLGEAMACGVPCVTTDIGDSAWIVGDAGMVVPPCNSEALADALGRLVGLGCEGRRRLGAAARARVVEHFEVDAIVGQYEALYERCSEPERVGARA
jgi:glycosyltransferase involved in cell wall biosynthesis